MVRSDYEVLVREDGDQAGFGTADGKAALDVFKTPQGGRLSRFVIRSGYERQGRGTAVLAKACDWADERGEVLYSPDAMPEAIPRLLAVGFVLDGDVYRRHPRRPSAT
ncbi:GNAT family N-acetyltransferase [Micromonospora sp. C97]|uniref:GNAT family N-acetyltransferase n=1 Tax=Micromonospora sp. C97 TaxID=2824883 RepID=UPI0035B45AEB